MTGTDWRHDTLHRLRMLIEETDAAVTKETKWAKASNPTGVPTWSRNGMFNASLDAGTRRAIDIVEGSTLDESALMALIGAAVDFNAGRAVAKQPK